MSQKTGFLSKALAFSFAIFCLAFSGYVFYIVYSETSVSVIPFDTDESDHANPSLYLYLAIKHRDLGEIYNAIVRQAFYPPLYSLVICANYFISGISFATSRLPALFCFIFYAFLIYASVKKTLSTENYLFKLPYIALILAVTSPITIFNSSLCMLELPGLVAVSLCILAFFTERIPLQIAAALAVFFVKYNFGIISIPAVILTILIGRGFQKSVAAGALVSFSLVVWSLITNFESFKNFFTGHKSYAPMLSSENIFFELNAWIQDYTIHPLLGVLLLALALTGLLAYRNKPPVIFSGLNIFFAFFVLFLSTTNEERHFMVALPSLIYLSSLGMAASYRAFIKIERFGMSYLFTGLVMFLFYLRVPEIRTQLRTQFEGEAGFSELFQFIYDNTDMKKPVLLYGISDSFSIEALRWYFSRNSGTYYTKINLDAYPYREDKNKTAKKRMRNLDAPFKDSTFPTKPLSKIIERDYYGHAVHIFNKEKKQRFQREGDELKSLLAPKFKNRAAAGSHEIEVYKLL